MGNNNNNTNTNTNNNTNNNNTNNTNNGPYWYETLDYDLNLPDQTPFKYTPADTQNVGSSSVGIGIIIVICIALLSIVFLYMRTNGYSLGNFFKNFKRHMYLSGKGRVKIRPISTKVMVVPNR